MYRNLCFLLLTILFYPFFSTSSIEKEGLPLFWWKEGNFINFGDHISLKMVERIVGGPLECYNKKNNRQEKKMLATGSIFYFANQNDIVWGSGINGKRLSKADYVFTQLDVRAVRGPITRDFLKDNFEIIAPEIYGDPALLFPYLFPEFKREINPQLDYVVIVHYLDIPYFKDVQDPHIVFATDPWDKVIKAILNSRFVISSSLHGAIIAEAYGIPARLLRLSDKEPLLKFYDYYLGSGRSGFQYAVSVEEALLMGGEPPAVCDLEQLYNSFPFEFWPKGKFHKINFKEVEL